MVPGEGVESSVAADEMTCRHKDCYIATRPYTRARCGHLKEVQPLPSVVVGGVELCCEVGSQEAGPRNRQGNKGRVAQGGEGRQIPAVLEMQQHSSQLHADLSQVWGLGGDKAGQDRQGSLHRAAVPGRCQHCRAAEHVTHCMGPLYRFTVWVHCMGSLACTTCTYQKGSLGDNEVCDDGQGLGHVTCQTAPDHRHCQRQPRRQTPSSRHQTLLPPPLPSQPACPISPSPPPPP